MQVVQADATRLPLESGRFSAATSFAMLHHVPSRELQDRLLAELCRVLRPGGLLVGSDAVDTGELDEFHRGDTYVPCDPDDMPARLRAAGFRRRSGRARRAETEPSFVEPQAIPLQRRGALTPEAAGLRRAPWSRGPVTVPVAGFLEGSPD